MLDIGLLWCQVGRRPAPASFGRGVGAPEQAV